MAVIYISPPFGNYVRYKDCIRVRGTFTWKRRPGIIKQCIKTIRPVRGGWRNAIGFRNPGLSNVEIKKSDTYSIAALDSNWDIFLQQMPYSHPSFIELNVGCPNVNKYDISDKEISAFVRCVEEGYVKGLSVKLSPVNCHREYIKRLHGLGIRRFHLSNAVPTPEGGISGYSLKKINLTNIENAAKLNLKDVEIIAGGGVYKPQDVKDYWEAGANSFSLATIWFSPWKVPAVYKEISFLS